MNVEVGVLEVSSKLVNQSPSLTQSEQHSDRSEDVDQEIEVLSPLTSWEGRSSCSKTLGDGPFSATNS